MPWVGILHATELRAGWREPQMSRLSHLEHMLSHDEWPIGTEVIVPEPPPFGGSTPGQDHVREGGIKGRADLNEIELELMLGRPVIQNMQKGRFHVLFLGF